MTTTVIMLLLALYAIERARSRQLRTAAAQAALATHFLRAAPTPLFVLDTSGRIVHATQAAAQLFGYSLADIQEVHFSTMLASSSSAHEQQQLHRILQAPVVCGDVYRIEGRCRDQTTISVELRSKTIVANSRTWIVVAFRDLTSDDQLRTSLQRHVEQLVQSKDALRRYNTSLEGIVREQTAKLRAAKDSAESANAAKSDFLANMSHELRTPLHGILSFARLGTRKLQVVELEKLGTYFEKIETSGKTLLNLLNSLLDLSKLEARAVTLCCEALSLGELASTVADEFSEIAREKELVIRLPEPDRTVQVWADPEKLSQVIRNLLGNAVKFTPRGGEIAVTVAADCGVAVLSVQDSGIGIPDDECERVFEKFVQSQRTKSGSGGTGLGLSICRELIALHRGSIRAVPTHGQGALVRIELAVYTSSPRVVDSKVFKRVTPETVMA